MSRVVLVTRTADDCIELQELVRHADIAVHPYPVLRFESVDDGSGWTELLRCLPAPALAAAAWLVLASPRAAGPFAAQARRRGAEHLLSLPTAAVGEGTARAAAAAGLEVRVVGPGTGEELAAALVPRLEPGAAVVFPCGRDRRPELPQALAEAGHPVLAVEVYRMRRTPRTDLPPVPAQVDAVVLTSPRAASFYLEDVGGTPLPCPHWALGPTTRDAAAGLGIDCRTPSRPDLTSLAEVLCVS